MKTRTISYVLAIQAFAMPSAQASTKLQHPHFAHGTSGSKSLLNEVIRNADARIRFNHYYTISYVSCGIACGSYWFVDSRNAAVIAAPSQSRPGEMVWDLQASATSAMVVVVYGPDDGFREGCSKQIYRMKGQGFLAATARLSIACP